MLDGGMRGRFLHIICGIESLDVGDDALVELVNLELDRGIGASFADTRE